MNTTTLKLPKVLLVLLPFVIACESSSSSNEGKNTLRYREKIENHYYDFERTFLEKPQKLAEIEAPQTIFWLKFQEGKIWSANNQHLVQFEDSLTDFQVFANPGEGPEENNTIAHFWAEKDSYNIFDAAKQRVASYNFRNKLIREYKYNLDDLPYVDFFAKIPKQTDEIMLAYESKNGEGLPDLYLEKAKLLSNQRESQVSLRKLLDIESRVNGLDILLDGEFVGNSLYQVFFCYRFGKFIIYNLETKRYQVHSTIDQTPMPKLKKQTNNTGGYSFVAQPNFIFFPSASVSKKYLYLLSNIDKNQRSIDRYELESGNYDGSFALPPLDDGQLAEVIALSPDDQRLWVAYDNLSLIEYRLK